MLDLQKFSAEMFEVKWFDGTVIKIRKPSRAMEISFINIKDKKIDEKTALTFLINLMYEIFNMREPVYVQKNGILNKVFKKKELLKITEADIEKIPYEALFVVLTEYFEFYYKSLKLGE